MQFSDPQSVTRSKGQPPTSCACLRKKAAGTLGSLLVRATSNHKILRLNPSTAPCIGNPYGLACRILERKEFGHHKLKQICHLPAALFSKGKGVG